ncbi:hypothetical protein GCM10011533_21400 [Streptosporangium jomthongense]|uniref:CCGSCS motif protein n=1 Tax=Marinobacter aromaticivorans TaxID=1494078 RepID=A0ABW2IWS0_9GAMM|nr:CCGSCS motif protein [Marinobacter aromaticivorans]GGE68758.1 hypothetical protein GCM10011533_21400 [Streptosporangium jomthongense]
MTQLFKEVTSPKNADEATAEELKAGATQESSEAPVTASENTTREGGKHGDPGVCCGGCS